MKGRKANPYLHIYTPTVSADCPNCLHAVVGRGELCHCQFSAFFDVPLAMVTRRQAARLCDKFASMED